MAEKGLIFGSLSINDLQNRGVKDVFIAAIDRLSGFREAIHSVFPETKVQRCVIHQIRYSLKYVVLKDRKAFVANLKIIYRATRVKKLKLISSS